MTDAELKKLLRLAALERRKETARSLLAGNDTGCFTTRQFEERFIVRENETYKHSPTFTRETYERIFDSAEWGREMLRSIPSVVREVKPDVWAAVEQATT